MPSFICFRPSARSSRRLSPCAIPVSSPGSLLQPLVFPRPRAPRALFASRRASIAVSGRAANRSAAGRRGVDRAARRSVFLAVVCDRWKAGCTPSPLTQSWPHAVGLFDHQPDGAHFWTIPVHARARRRGAGYLSAAILRCASMALAAIHAKCLPHQPAPASAYGGAGQRLPSPSAGFQKTARHLAVLGAGPVFAHF